MKSLRNARRELNFGGSIHSFRFVTGNESKPLDYIMRILNIYRLGTTGTATITVG